MNVAYVSLCLAGLSLGASGYQAYLNSKNLEVVQRDIGRREVIRGCKDVIEAYFDAKLRISRLAVAMMGAPARDAEMLASAESAGAVTRFAALGTYLANFQGEEARAEYTLLARDLETLQEAAKRSSAGLPDGFFHSADARFSRMNADCARASAQFLN